ncbi:MAG: cytochrome b561 [Hyphococcus sp.]|nr:MAG: cytochrome b561 [Marinicaulis sp.]
MPDKRYNSVAVALHWAMAILIIGQIAGGLYMHNLPNTSPIKFDLFQLHKSFGITVLILTFIRLAWRFTHPAPALPSEMPGWQKLAARITHWGFYALLILTPLAGWAMVSVSPKDIPTFFFGLFQFPHLPFFEGVSDAAAMEETFKDRHEFLAFAILGLLALHVGAALKHQFINRDGVLRSMLPASLTAWIGMAVIFGALGLGVVLYSTSSPSSFAPAGSEEALAPAGDIGGVASEDTKANWSVDYDASSLKFIGEEKGKRFEGAFSSFNAEINFDKNDLSASSIRVDVTTRSGATGDELRDTTMTGGEWFDVKDHPTAMFTSTQIEKTGENTYRAPGELRIKDIARDVTLDFTLVITGDQATATGSANLIRTEFALGDAASWLDKEKVALDVRVEFEIFAVRNGQN